MSRGHPRHRPPWWPGDEPWPPRSRRGVVTTLLRGIVIAVAAWLVLGITFGVLVGLIAGHRGHGWDGPPPQALVVPVLVLLLAAGFGLARSARRWARPVDDIVDTIQRLGDGDYAARPARAAGVPALRELSRSLASLGQRLEQDEAHRRAFVADIAHELRTPLTVIQGTVEGMLDGVYPADESHLGAVLAEARLLARLVEDLRTLSLADAGVLQLHPEPLDAAALARNVVDAFTPRAAAQGVALVAEAGAEVTWTADPARLRQVLENLVENALRHTPPGGVVTVSANVGEDGLAFAITDTGSGIPPDELAHVFDRYRTSGEAGGSGLGLAIARQLTEAHGGTIHAESAPGRGTRIAVVVPRR